MTNLLEKARIGRTNALAGLAANLGDTTATGGAGARFRNANRYTTLTFVSKRSQNPQPFLLN